MTKNRIFAGRNAVTSDLTPASAETIANLKENCHDNQ